MAADPIYPGTIKSYGCRINNSTTPATLATGGANGTRLEHLTVYNDHTTTVTVNLLKVNGGATTQLLQTTVATKGTVNLLNLLDALQDKQYRLLGSGVSLQGQVASAVANNVDFDGDGGDY